MRLLQVSNGFPPEAFAGVELHTLQLCRALRERHTVAVFCRTGNLRLPEFTLQEDLYEGLPVSRVNNNFLDMLDFERFYRQPEIEAHFRTFLRSWKPDLIHFQHCIGLSAALPMIAREEGFPSLLTLHDYWYICPTVQLLNVRMERCPGTHHAPNCFECVAMGDARLARLRRSGLYALARRLPDPVKDAMADVVDVALGRSPRARARTAVPQPASEAQRQAIAARVEYMRNVLRCPVRLTAPSRFVKDTYIEFGVPAELIEVVPLGMEIDRWRALERPPAPPANGLRFAFLGGLLPHKGVTVILEAFRCLPDPNHRLDLYGFTAPDRRFARTLRDLVAADKRMKMHRAYRHEDLPGILQQMDVLLVPALWHETYSFVVREALLAGVWVMASDVGVIRELVRSGQNGVLVPPGEVGAWAEALHLVVRQWPPAGRSAELTFQPMTFAHYADAMEALYRAVLQPASAAR